MRLPLRSYYTSTSYGAIECSEKGTDPRFYGLQLSYQKGELDLKRHWEAATKEEIIGDIDKGIPTALILNDAQVLSVSIPYVGTDEDILNEAYPNLDIQHFYYQIHRTSKRSFISVCRKAHIEHILKEFSDLGIGFTSVFLGNLCTSILPAYIHEPQIQTSTDTIVFEDSEMKAIQSQAREGCISYSIGSVSVPSTSVLGLSAILCLLTSEEYISGNTTELDAKLRKKYGEKRFFTRILSLGLGSLLLFLLLNFLIFSSVYSSWQSLQEEVRTYTVQNQAILEQQKRVARKEKMVASILTTGFSKSSFYADQLLSRLPESIRLDSYEYQPLERKIQKNKQVQLALHQIRIEGSSTQKQDFTDWVQSVEDLEFVEKTTLLSYGQSSSGTPPGFKLQIQLRHDTEN